MTLNQGHPEEAVSYNLGTKTVMLSSGSEVPIGYLFDDCGNELEDCTIEDLRNYDELRVLAGPLPSGDWLSFTIYPDDRPVVKH